MTVQHDASLHPKTVTEFSRQPSAPATRRKSGRRTLVTNRSHITLPEALMEAARAALRPGERIIVVSATEIRIVPSGRTQA